MSWYRRKFREEEENADVNLSPLLDMVFILLIFFVVTTTFTRETGVEVKKPKADSARQIDEKILKVAVTREGTMHIFEKQVDLDVLESLMVREVSKNPSIRLVIVADSHSITERVVQIIDRANNSGIRDTSIATLRD